MLRSDGSEEAAVRQAFGWLTRLQSSQPDPKTLRAFQQWRAERPEHERAWLRAQQVSHTLREDLQTLPSSGAFDALQLGSQRLSRRRAIAKLSVGAATALPMAWWMAELAPWQRMTADFSTAKGEQRHLTLSDGTALALNTDSAVELRFDDRQRLLKLTRGEIALISGRDASAAQKRPLRVQTSDGLLEAMGTRFTVRLLPDASLLTVDEGAVAMYPVRGAFGSSWGVAQAGDSYRVDSHGVDRADSNGLDPTGWTDGALVARDMRLADFLSELGRYRTGYLACDARAAELRLSGVYRLDDTERLLAILPSVLPVRIDYRTRFWVQVSMR